MATSLIGPPATDSAPALTAMEQRLAARLRLAAESQGLLLKSFGDLLHHPNPPLELLRLTKDFAKACRLSRSGPLPREIATLLYFASIIVAWVRSPHVFFERRPGNPED